MGKYVTRARNCNLVTNEVEELQGGAGEVFAKLQLPGISNFTKSLCYVAEVPLLCRRGDLSHRDPPNRSAACNASPLGREREGLELC
jgi:hypothetical protein